MSGLSSRAVIASAAQTLVIYLYLLDADGVNQVCTHPTSPPSPHAAKPSEVHALLDTRAHIPYHTNGLLTVGIVSPAHHP